MLSTSFVTPGPPHLAVSLNYHDERCACIQVGADSRAGLHFMFIEWK